MKTSPSSPNQTTEAAKKEAPLPFTVSAIWPRRKYDDEPASYEALVYDANGNVWATVRTHSHEITQRQAAFIVESCNSAASSQKQLAGLREALRKYHFATAAVIHATNSGNLVAIEDAVAALRAVGEEARSGLSNPPTE